MTYHFRAAAIPSPAAAPAEAPSAPADAAAPLSPPTPALDDPALRETALFDRARQSAFLTALAECGSARAAARAAGVSHQTVYRQRRACAVFRRGWDGALVAARAVAEEALACRAIDGLEEEVWFRGEVVGTRRRYDTRLLLAHLARLDKLAEDAEARAFAEDFEGSLGRFEQGSDTPEIDPTAPPPPPAPAPAAGEAREEAPGQWSTRSTPATETSDPAPDPGRPRGLEWCPHKGRLLPYIDRMLNAMDAARPPGAPTPGELFCAHLVDDIEAVQMAAFEAGVERWWLVVPPEPGDPEGDWRYCED